MTEKEKEKLQKIWAEIGRGLLSTRETEMQVDDEFSKGYCRGYAEALLYVAIMIQKEFNIL